MSGHEGSGVCVGCFGHASELSRLLCPPVVEVVPINYIDSGFGW